MSRSAVDSDYDKTLIQFDEADRGRREETPFTPVAVAPGHQAPRNALYLAQQTSLEEYTPGLNPLVNAAANLLLEIGRLRNGREVDLEALRARLEAEVRGFNSQAVSLGVSEAQVNAAQYLLCTALDESVTTSAIPGAQGEWQQKSLLSTFHKDTWGGEVFFDVLGRTMEQPAGRLYLLELIYLLLSLGFEGKYRLQERGQLAVESLRDQLFRQIRLLRGEPSPDLAKKLPPGNFKSKIYAYVPLWLIAAVVCFCLSVTFCGFSFTLDGKADPLLSRLSKHAPVGKLVAETKETPAEAPTEEPIETAAGPADAPEAAATTQPVSAEPAPEVRR